ncbi:MAG: TonB-dependent receptor [Melioribacteraceae bacterium]|nr:TonB-dependent receptor [Melioribacteraceae bacterium]
MHRKFFQALLLLTLVPFLLFAGTKGRIKGKVLDLETGDPLIGANLIVVGTNYGTATDANGDFVILNLDAGVYSVRASYLGYKTITVTDLRVNADLTTEVTFELPPDAFEVETVVIKAEKPLIQKDATSSVRIATSEDIKNLPVRGVTAVIALQAGVVNQNGLHLRGSRSDEVGYYLDGVDISSPISGSRTVSISPDAVEEIAVETGSYSAEFGGANGGIIRTQLRTGTTDYHASVEYITDNIGFQSFDDFYQQDGTRLGAYWYGSSDFSAVLSGPVPMLKNVKFFLNVRSVFDKDFSKRGYSGFDYGYVGDGLADQPELNDSLWMVHPEGVRYNNGGGSYNIAGTVTMDFNPITLRIGGTLTSSRNNAASSSPYWLLNNREGITDGLNNSISLKLTHVLSANMFYEVNAGYTSNWGQTYDAHLGRNFWAYGDSVANANAGVVWNRRARESATNWTGRYRTPRSYNIYGFSFAAPGATPVNYSEFDQSQISVNAAFSLIAGKNHTMKIGGEFKQFTLRSYTVGSQSTFANNLDQGLTKDQILYQFGVNNYGYDIYGEKTDEDGFYAPHKPTFASFFIQDRIEFTDIILKLGLRYDYIDIDNKEFVDPSRPELGIGTNHNQGNLLEAGFKDVPTFSAVSPRISVSFPVTDKTVFHAGFGKYVQQPGLNQTYLGYHALAYRIGGGFFFSDPDGANIRPTRKTHYSVGFRQELTDFMAFDLTGFYDDIKGQVYFDTQDTDRNSPYQSYNIKANGDFATTKGVEITLNMRRYERVQLNASLSFQDARGTGSFPNGNAGIVGAPLDGVTVFRPQYVSPLSFNQSVFGSVNLDYRFGANDGPTFLHQFGINVLATFNSGHPYTRGFGESRNFDTDSRFRQPLEPLNASITPSQFQVDLKIDKSFEIMDMLNANVYVRVVNLFDTRSIDFVYGRTGAHDDDGWISNPDSGQKQVEQYGQIYEDIYRSLNFDYNDFFGQARQIYLGVRLEY